MDIVERLRANYSLNDSSGEAHMGLSAADEIERLREGLQWYADKENYATGQDCPDVLIDGGDLARRTLEQSAKPSIMDVESDVAD